MDAIPEILIVGAGPAGLILALTLAHNGIPVRIIEKSTSPRLGQRGAGLMPRTFEVFEALGIVQEVLDTGINVPIFRIYEMPGGTKALKEFTPAPILEPTPSQPYRNVKLLGQDNLDRILRTELEKHGVSVELGMELQSFEQFEDRVVVKTVKYDLKDEVEAMVREASYKWVVGADGAKSVVRKQLGITFLGETKEQRFIMGDAIVDGLEANVMHIWGDWDDVLTSVRSTDTPGSWNFVIGGNNMPEKYLEYCESDTQIIEMLKKGTSGREDIKWNKITFKSPYKVNVRMAGTFKKDRVLITGDAGHVHSPAGGQGMNTGIQDSFNLGWKLALVIKKLAPEILLESFTEERLPVVSEMLNITNGILKRTLHTNNEDAWKRSGNINQLGVNYRFSSIIVDEESEALGLDRTQGSTYEVDINQPVRAGDRAPDAPGIVAVKVGVNNDPTRLFSWLQKGASQFGIIPKDLLQVIVIFKAMKSDIPNEIEEMAFEDRAGHAYNAYKGPDEFSGVFIIRPDGVIGARVGGEVGVQRYFRHILG